MNIVQRSLFATSLLTLLLSGCQSDVEVVYIGDVNDTTPLIEEPDDIEQNTTTQTRYLEPYQYQQWYMYKDSQFYYDHRIDSDAHIHMPQEQYSGIGVKVAIIDDGLDMYHQDLQSALYATYDLSSKTTDVTPSNSEDYHGTAVTGLIGARYNEKGILGIAYESSIIFLKYKSAMTDSEVIELFEKANDLGADIISCSWGTYGVSDAVVDEIEYLSKYGRGGKGTLVVFAVGNDGLDLDSSGINDESEIPSVISVGATDRTNERASYSNYGNALDVMAPGGYYTAMTTLDLSGYAGENSGDYILYDGNFVGTSAAAPVVSGVLALLLQKYPNLTHDEVVELLHNTSDKIGDYYDANGFDRYTGYGKINVSRLLQ